MHRAQKLDFDVFADDGDLAIRDDHVENGEEFVPRLFAELDVAITSVAVSRPTLDDVFMRYTGTTIRDAETAGPGDLNRAMMRAMAGARR